MGEILDDPNRQAVGLEPAWVEGDGASDNLAEAAPKAKGKAETEADVEAKARAEREKLPGQHAGLDELAAERGYEWSRDDLTVAEKQAELGGGDG